MIKKLRRKFIFVNMLLVTLVLLAVFTALLGFTWQQLRGQTQGALLASLEWREELPRFEIGSPPPDQRPFRDNGRKFAMVPVFCVTVDGQGDLSSLRSGGNVFVSEEVLAQAVEQAEQSGGTEGTLGKLGLRYLSQTDPEGNRRIAFADLSWEQDNLTHLVLTSLLVGAGAWGIFFLISLFLSALALRPVAQAWEQQRQFVADASHELKTPLTVILANTGIVLAHPADTVAGQSKWIGYIQEEAGRMKSLVEDLLFLAKRDAGRQPAHTMEVCLSDLAEGCLLPFEPVAFEAGVALSSQITPDLRLTGDAGQLRRLMMILLDNAVKYAGDGGVVAVTLTRSQERLRFSVHNTGVPIPPEHMPRLFERFYRVDKARSREKGGTGLGLAIAKEMVEAHKGTIHLDSTEGVGTTVTIVLPTDLPLGGEKAV